MSAHHPDCASHEGHRSCLIRSAGNAASLRETLDAGVRHVIVQGHIQVTPEGPTTDASDAVFPVTELTRTIRGSCYYSSHTTHHGQCLIEAQPRPSHTALFRAPHRLWLDNLHIELKALVSSTVVRLTVLHAQREMWITRTRLVGPGEQAGLTTWDADLEQDETDSIQCLRNMGSVHMADCDVSNFVGMGTIDTQGLLSIHDSTFKDNFNPYYGVLFSRGWPVSAEHVVTLVHNTTFVTNDAVGALAADGMRSSFSVYADVDSPEDVVWWQPIAWSPNSTAVRAELDGQPWTVDEPDAPQTLDMKHTWVQAQQEMVVVQEILELERRYCLQNKYGIGMKEREENGAEGCQDVNLAPERLARREAGLRDAAVAVAVVCAVLLLLGLLGLVWRHRARAAQDAYKKMKGGDHPTDYSITFEDKKMYQRTSSITDKSQPAAVAPEGNTELPEA